MRCPTGTRLSSHKRVGVSHHPESGNPGQVGLQQGRLTPAESEAQWQARWQACPSAGNSEWLPRGRAPGQERKVNFSCRQPFPDLLAGRGTSEFPHEGAVRDS